MKTISFFIAVLVSMVGISVQADNNPARLTGTIANSSSKYAILSFMGNEEQKTDTIFLKTDGSFTYNKQIANAGYYLITVPKTHFVGKLFLENGTSTNLKVDISKPDTYDVTGDLESTYDFSEKAERLFEKYSDPSKFSNFKTYENALMASKDSLQTLLQKEKSEGFKIYEKKSLEDTFEMIKMGYINLFMHSDKAFDSDPDFNAMMENINLNDRKNVTNGQSINYLYWKASCQTREKSRLIYPILKIIKEKVSDKSVAKELAYDLAKSYFSDGPDADVDKAYALCKDLLSNEEYAELTPIYHKMKAFAEGHIAPDFDMFDAAGKKVRLSDLEGKVVFMDIWATWCGPCRQEIPFMAKLAAHYKNNPKIHFVSVSVDNNVQSWKAMIAKDKPQWTQYIATDKDSKLGTLYNIEGIPRFMMFDKDGKIISINAPRPSEEDIYNFIDKHI